MAQLISPVSPPRPHAHHATALSADDKFQFYYRGDTIPGEASQLLSESVGLTSIDCGKRGFGPNFPSFSSFVFPQTSPTDENFGSNLDPFAQTI